MAEPLHLQPDPEPAYEQVRLGDQVIELDPTSARTVREAFEALGAQYGAALEEYRRQALAGVGTPQAPMPFLPQGPEPLTVPDPDVLFQNKQQWTDDFARSLESKLGSVRGEATQLVQGAVQAFQQELNRRDAAAQARAIHDAAMEEMLERRGLGEHTRIVQAIYNEQYKKLEHLPLEMGLDKIGQMAEEEIARIRAGEKWTMSAAPTQTGTAARPPARLLRSSARAAAPAPAPAEPQGLQEPGGGLGMMGKIIRKRQAALLGGSA